MDPFLQREVDAVARQVKLEYAGKDPNTKEKASCANWVSCDNFLLDLQRKDRGEANIERKMLKCSSCKVLRYCSRSCQVAHFSEHKAGCREIREARKKVGALETAMRGGPIAAWDENAYTDWSNNRMDYFKAGVVGTWWGLLDPRNYCRAVHQLIDLIRYMGWNYEVKPVWEEIAQLQLELLRCNLEDQQGIGNELASVLLYLNRDDDCFQYIKWWSYNLSFRYQRGYKTPDDELCPVWAKGEFVYKEAGGDRFQDVYPMFNDQGEPLFGAEHKREQGEPEVDLEELGVEMNGWHGAAEPNQQVNLLAALAVIKMRVLAHLDAQRLALLESEHGSNSNSTSTSTSNSSSDPNAGMATGADGTTDTRHAAIEAQMSEQKRLLHKYLHMLHRQNKYFLHIVAKDSLQAKMHQQGRPHTYSPNSPEEAFLVMDGFMRHMARVPSFGMKYLPGFIRNTLQEAELQPSDLAYKSISMMSW